MTKALVAIGMVLLFGVAVMLLVPVYKYEAQLPPPIAASTTSPAFHDCSFDHYQPIRISDWFTARNVIKSVRPTYPKDAYAKGISGQVQVKLLISLNTGLVEKACAYSGPPELWVATEDAAIQWQFKKPPSNPSRRYAVDFAVFDFVASR